MPRHQESRHLPYTKEQMFAVVADIEEYPKFLPWCVGLRIKNREQSVSGNGHPLETLTADLAVRFKMFRETFTSRAVLNPELGEIKVEYLDGPFEYLENDWAFFDEDGGCRIDFFIEFRFRSAILEKLIASMYEEAVHRMVKAFVERAEVLYGPGAKSQSGS